MATPGDKHSTSTRATGTVTELQNFLSKLGQGYKRAKANQIVRLLKDQEYLNQRFIDCALDDDADQDEARCQEYLNARQMPNDATHDGSLRNRTDHGVNNSSQKSTSTLRKKSNVDGSRCLTSMGFHNQGGSSGSVDGDEDRELEGDADQLNRSFDSGEITMTKLPAELRPRNPQRQMWMQPPDDAEVFGEENARQFNKSSRPKTGVASGSAQGKQYRRPPQNDSVTRNKNTPHVSTTVSKLEPYTPRGGVRVFCDSQSTPRCDFTSNKTPRYNELSLCLSPRKGEQNVNFTPRGGNNNDIKHYSSRQNNNNGSHQTPRDVNGLLTPRQSEVIGYYTPRGNDVSGFYTPRQRDVYPGSRPNDFSGMAVLEDIPTVATPRGNPHQRQVRNIPDYHSLQLEELATTCMTPRFDDAGGGVTPRSLIKYNAPVSSKHGPKVSQSNRNGKIIEKTIFDMNPISCNEPSRAKKATGNNFTPESPRYNGHYVSRGVLSVDQSPIHVIPSGTYEGDVTPRRQKIETKSKKPRNNNDMQRMGVHQNLNKLSDQVHPIAVMKLPPLDVTINKQVVS